MNGKNISTYIAIGLVILSCQSNSKNISSVIKSPKTGNEIILTFKIDSIDISEMTSANLRLLRNEIFARHGYIFKSQELTDYFSQFDWYQPVLKSDQIDSELTKIDRYNISLINSLEGIKKQKSLNWKRDLQYSLEQTKKDNLIIGISKILDYKNRLVTKPIRNAGFGNKLKVLSNQ